MRKGDSQRTQKAPEDMPRAAVNREVEYLRQQLADRDSLIVQYKAAQRAQEQKQKSETWSTKDHLARLNTIILEQREKIAALQEQLNITREWLSSLRQSFSSAQRVNYDGANILVELEAAKATNHQFKENAEAVDKEREVLYGRIETLEQDLAADDKLHAELEDEMAKLQEELEEKLVSMKDGNGESADKPVESVSAAVRKGVTFSDVLKPTAAASPTPTASSLQPGSPPKV